jgi:polyisoprenoid-binding protein YceI
MQRAKLVRPSHLIAPALAAALTFSLLAAAKLAKVGSSTAGFKASGPAGMNIPGETSDMSVADDGATVTITVPLGNLKTGMDLRDKHMKDALEVQSHPNAELRVARAALKFPAAGAESSGDAKGSLKLHGQTRDVTFKYTAKNDGGVLTVKGNTRIDMKDYGIKPPSYLGVAVKPDVDIYANFQAKD